MRETVTAVTSDDIYVLVALVQADEGDEVDWFEDLARPLIVDLEYLASTSFFISPINTHCACLGEPVSSPLLKFGEAPVFLLLPDFVVATTYYKIVVLLIARCESHILVWIGLVVNNTIFHRAFRYANGNAIRAQELHLGHDAQFLEWYTGRFQSVFAGNSKAFLGTDANIFGAYAQNLDPLFLHRHYTSVSKTAEVWLVR